MTRPKAPARPARPHPPASHGPAPDGPPPPAAQPPSPDAQSLLAAIPAFAPAQLQRPRGSGWTPDRQRKFIEALAASACVTEAAASVGLSPTSAYNLRRRPDAAAFRLAWDAAIDFGMRRLVDAALARAVHGVAVPVFWQGEQVGERREYPERLAMFLMRAHDPARFGGARADAPTRRDAAETQLAQAIALLGDQPPAAAPGKPAPGEPADPLRLPGPATDDTARPSD